ncbi:hypothetical protein ACEWY4_001352 [Coilia grayii]|uniref:Cation channel complex component UNC80 N-terminal domain-containing protein n=1 Tax=Coilia grayii TaxID=363190 RepID=A0ABD1KSN9_9TELE
MVKRKSQDETQADCGRGIPFPIQTFLWRQTSAFLRPKLGKQYEASCVSFERVLVENKLHGLSPALTEAIQSISRYELLQAALPHVLHCTAILLSNRNKLGHQDKLGVAETKLLHTLHWMLLEAPQECPSGMGSHAFPANQSGTFSSGSTEEDENIRLKLYQRSMATVELFIFLFAPLINRIKESDLTFRLASGLVIWQPMWEHRQPDVPVFSTFIKPARNIVTAKRTSTGIKLCPSQDDSNSGTVGIQVVCETSKSNTSPSTGGQGCHRGNSVESGGLSQHASQKSFSAPDGPPVASERARYATFFDVAVLRCLLQPHWVEEGVYWALMFYLQRLRQILEEKSHRQPEQPKTALPRPRSSSMVAVAPSLVNTHKTQGKANSPTTETSQTSSMELTEQFDNLRSALLSELTQSIHTAVKKDLDTALAPLNSTLNQVKELYGSQEERICGVGTTLDQTEQRLSLLEAKLATAITENAWLKDKVDDLENCSCRLNLRVVGIPERVEGSNPVGFMTHFFNELFGMDFFPTPPVLARAHRLGSLATSDASDAPKPPRVFIVAFHNYQDKQRIVEHRRRRDMKFRGNKIFIHEDVSAELGRKQKAFKEAKALLYAKGVKFRMRYPARLKVSFQNSKLFFDTPEAAMEFYRQQWCSHTSVETLAS